MYRLVGTTLLAASLSLATSVSIAQADTLKIYVSEQATEQQMPVPSHGQSMESVRQSYGTPQKMQDPVGNPPISVWRYDQFTVYFERDKVIRTVIHHKPTQ